MSKGTVYVWDPARQEVVTREEMTRREAKRKPTRHALPAFLDHTTPERGRWVYDRATGKLVPAEEYYGSRSVDAPYVIGDIQPYRSMQTGEIIGGRRQHREHLRQHGLVEVGNERVERKPKPRPDPRHDIKDSIDYLRAGHPAGETAGRADRDTRYYD